MPQESNYIYLKNVELIFRNFSGNELKYNKSGDRNFCAIVSSEQAEDLERLGFNIKYIPSRDKAYIKVNVSYKIRTPKVVLGTSAGKEELNEDTIHRLDLADITFAEVVISPYNWEVSGDTGVSAYLKTLYCEIYEDELELKIAAGD